MRSTRDEFEPWLRDYLRKRYPELEPALLAAIDAFDRVQNAQHIDSGSLALLVEAASSPRRPLYENATPFLAKLSEAYAEAREAIAKMAEDPRGHVRFNAILCLDKTTPLSLAIPVISQGLRDRNAKVRCKAADWAGRLRIRELVPDLEDAAAREKNPKTKACVVFELKPLRDGYILEPGPDGGFEVTTFCRAGITCRLVQRSEMESRGLDAIVAELAAGPSWLS